MINIATGDVVIIHFDKVKGEQPFEAKIIKIYNDLIHTKVPLIKFKTDDGEENICCCTFIIKVLTRAQRLEVGSMGGQRPY